MERPGRIADGAKSRAFSLARLVLCAFIALPAFLLLLPAASHAATLALTSPVDTSYAPGVIDDTVAIGDTFILELWADCVDTDVNGAEATIVFDGAQLELLESADASDSFFGAGGINSDEDHTVFGDIHMNHGVSPGTATDTARYAALPYVDSTRAITRLVRFTFQVRPTASAGLTAVTFRSTAEETTALTAADAGATNALAATDTGLILITQGDDTHAVLTLVSPLGAEYFAVYNATDQTLDLSKFYVSTDDSNYITTTTAAPAVSSGAFIARFPNGATLAAGETVTVTLSSDTFHRVHPGVRIDYEVDQDGAADSVTDMTMIVTSGTRALGDAGGTLVLFYWDGNNDLVKDLDILVWGAGTIPDKTGKSIDGVDGAGDTSTYLNDSALMTPAAAPIAGEVLRRTSWITGDTGANEPRTNGNGLTGHDETSESCSVSWAATTDSLPWHTMLIAAKRGNLAAVTAYTSETDVAGLVFTLKGAFGGAENLTQIDVASLGTADTANIDTVSLWIDMNSDSILDGGDSHVANLAATASRAWRYTGALALPATTGYNFIIGFDVDSTIETGETVQFSIDRFGIQTSVSDSGSFIAITNTAAITLSNPIVTVETAANIAAATMLAGDVNVTVMALVVRGYGADTLTAFALANGGRLDSSDVTVKLWADANGSLAWDAGDTAIGTLAWSAANSRWETTAMALPLAAGGETLIVTVDVAAIAAVEGDSFLATVPTLSAKSTNAESGPIAQVANPFQKTLVNPAGIANHVVIAAVYPDVVVNDLNGEWILLYNPTDTPQNLQSWTIRKAGVPDATLPDSTIAAHGWFLLADANYNANKDNSSFWPNADYLENITLNNTNFGLSLFDSTATVVDRFGYGTEAIDKEGTAQVNQAGPNQYDIYIRKPHALSVKADVLWGGRDEFGGAGYDSYDNATDFIKINLTDTNFWTLRNSASTPETPAAKTTVVRIAGADLTSDTFSLSQTNRLLMRLYIQGDTTASGTLQTFRIEATDTLADTNFASVRLYRDQNGDLLYDGGDSLVATLSSVTGAAAWESSAVNFSFNALAGETFLVVADIASFVTDGETFQPRVAIRTIGTAGIDSGPSIVRTSAAIFTLSATSPIIITKGPDIASDTVAPTADTLTVIAFLIAGEPTGDTLTIFEISNNGSLDTGDVAAVRLWQDADNDSTWSAADTLVSTLSASDSKTWRDTTLAISIGTGARFLVTIDLGAAGDGETFQAIIRSTTVDGALSETGPAANVTEPGVITVSSALLVTLRLSEVNVDGTPDYIELFMLDDGNGGAGVDISGWIIEDLDGGSHKIIGDADNNGAVDSTVTMRTGEFLVLWDAVGLDESDSGGDNVITLYDNAMSIVTEDDQAVLRDGTQTIRDAVAWSDRDRLITAGEQTEMQTLITAGAWTGYAQQGSAVNSPTLSLTAGTLSLQRDAALTDRDSYLDWGFAGPSPGETRTVEAILTAPAIITGLTFGDVPNDLGGNMKATWTPDTSQADFLVYRIYLETGAVGTLIAGDTNPFTTISDSSTGSYTFTGLTNGDSYWVSVTAVDSWGLEHRLGNAETGPFAPFINITETPVLMITEVFANSSGAADSDYIEIAVVHDGNPTGGLNLSGWKIEWSASAGENSTTLGDVTVQSGEFLVMDFEEATTTDDSDSGGDNVITLRTTSTGIVGTDAFVRILDPTGAIKSFVFISNRDGSLDATVEAAVRQAIDSSAWTGDSVQNAAVTPATGTSWNALDVIALAWPDSRQVVTRDSWSITRARTKGADNTGIESPAVVPAPPQMTIFQDVPDDFGGSVEIHWTPDTSLTDFAAYQVYLDTVSIGTRLDTSRVRPYATITDSSTGNQIVSGLVNGDSYWVTVTLVDSWGHERRSLVAESGPVAPLVNISGTPNLLFTEVKFADTDTPEFIEIRVINDGNAGGSLNLAGFKVTRDDTSTGDITTFGSVTVSDSDFIVLWNVAGTSETDSGGDGVVNIYNLGFSLAEGDENLFLIHPTGDTILDFVNWSTRSGSITSSELDDIAYAIARSAWNDLTDSQNNARNPLEYTNFYDSGSITRDQLFTDNNADTDWAIDWSPTPGALTSIAEAPFAAPAAVTGLTAVDAPNDFGGSINLSWTASGAPDLRHYNIYRETAPIPASLYTTNLYPRDTASAADTSKAISGLTNGETYYFAMTAVDSLGMELKIGLSSDSAVPAIDVSGETLLFTEVSFREDDSGVIGNDWVEILVVYDGNSGNGIDLTGWRVVTSAAANPAITFGAVTARTGDYILIHSAAGTDETDSGGDGVINLYFGATGLTATDNTLTFLKPTGDTADFVAWTQPSVPPVNVIDSPVIATAFANGHWTDIGGNGVGVEDGVNSDSATANWAISRWPDTTDLNTMADWTVDSTPTPGAANDSITYWRVSGTLDLESRALDGGCTVTAANGVETCIVFTDATGTYVLRIPNGAWNITAETTHYLNKAITGIVVNYASMSGQNIGTMYAGDANGDNLINIFDAAITNFAIDFATGNPAADHVDPAGTVNASDLDAVRNNFGRKGD